MRKLLLCTSFLVLLTGCKWQVVSEELSDADALLCAERNDSAYQILSGIKERYLINDEDRAYYYLLMTRAAILTGNATPTDSCIDSAISYYERKKEYENLSDAYYYKGYQNLNRKDYSTAMLLFKQGEEVANLAKATLQQYKNADAISALNGIDGKYNLQAEYASIALRCAETLKDKKRQAYSCSRLIEAFSYLEMEDSANYYAMRIVPYLGEVRKEDLPHFLTTIGNVFKESDSSKAKWYYNKALSYYELPSTLESLADIYYEEGNRDEAYRLWKRAVAIDDATPKDNIIYNILEYDVQHGNTDNVLDKVNEIMDIKDSIQRKLACDTLKDLQLRFDHEVEKHELDRQLGRSIIAIIALIVLVVVLSLYILMKRYRHRLLWTQTQIQIDNCNAQIRQLKESGEGAKKEVAELTARIEALKNSNSMRLNRGLILYNELMDNASIGKWSKEDYDAFIDYYDAIDHPTVKRLKKEYKNLTPRSLTYLLLKDMGKSDDTVREIMGLSPEGLRSLRFRVSHS